ncbi:MAG: pyridoxamine 5'-phosphate oxidase family protein [Candidatus Binatia bacterium]
MSSFLGNELTAELFERLSGRDVGAKAGKAILLVTVDDNNWPHPAMLSYHEVVAKSRGRIDLAVGKTSTTARNLRVMGKITFILTDAGMNYYIKGLALEIHPSMEQVPFMSLFRVNVDQLLEDQEPGAAITSGITFYRPANSEAEGVAEKIFHAVLKQA